jgi:hypothetical protein
MEKLPKFILQFLELDLLFVWILLQRLYICLYSGPSGCVGQRFSFVWIVDTNVCLDTYIL